MHTFWLYLQLGFEHISTWNGRFFGFEGYDHLLFLVALVAQYSLAQWRGVLILVTAFTLGHSLTLALATLGWVLFSQAWIEFLIPVSIFVTAAANFFVRVDRPRSPNLPKPRGFPKVYQYLLAGVFGLIHGLGFSNYLRALLGGEANLLLPLLGFNLGLEVGQLLVVAFLLLLSLILVNLLRLPRREWLLIQSTAAAVLAFQLLLSTYPN